MNIISAKNATWADAQGVSINLVAVFSELDGEVPFTASVLDSESYGQNLFNRAVAGEFGPIAPYVAPVVSPTQIIAEFTGAIQQRLDDFARTRNYDSFLSLASYATDPNPKFAAEGQYGVDVRSATWAKSYEIQAAVAAGDRPMPTLEQIMSELPVLEWPL